MALFGQLTKPAKELPLIDVSNPDIVMELLEFKDLEVIELAE